MIGTSILARRTPSGTRASAPTASSPAAAAALWQRTILWGVVSLAACVAFGVALYAGILPITPTQIADAAGYLLLLTTIVLFGWLFFGGDWTPVERKRLYVVGVFSPAAASLVEFEQSDRR